MLRRRSASSASISLSEIAEIHHAEHLLARRMRVAAGVVAGRLVVDRRDHGQHAMAVGGVDAAARGEVQPDERLAGGMAGVAGLGPLVHRSARFGRIGREGEPPLLVHHAHPLDALERADRLHRLVGRIAPVVEHVVVRACLDRVAEARRAPHDLVEKVALLQTDDEPDEQTHRNGGNDGQDSRQLDAEPVPPERPEPGHHHSESRAPAGAHRTRDKMYGYSTAFPAGRKELPKSPTVIVPGPLRSARPRESGGPGRLPGRSGPALPGPTGGRQSGAPGSFIGHHSGPNGSSSRLRLQRRGRTLLSEADGRPGFIGGS